MSRSLHVGMELNLINRNSELCNEYATNIIGGAASQNFQKDSQKFFCFGGNFLLNFYLKTVLPDITVRILIEFIGFILVLGGTPGEQRKSFHLAFLV